MKLYSKIKKKLLKLFFKKKVKEIKQLSHF